MKAGAEQGRTQDEGASRASVERAGMWPHVEALLPECGYTWAGAEEKDTSYKVTATVRAVMAWSRKGAVKLERSRQIQDMFSR